VKRWELTLCQSRDLRIKGWDHVSTPPITHPPRLGKDPAFEQTEISSYIQVKFDRDENVFFLSFFRS